MNLPVETDDLLHAILQVQAHLLNGEDSTIAILGESHGIEQPVPYTHSIQSKHAPFHTITSTQHVGRVPCIGVQGE